MVVKAAVRVDGRRPHGEGNVTDEPGAVRIEAVAVDLGARRSEVGPGEERPQVDRVHWRQLGTPCALVARVRDACQRRKCGVPVADVDRR
eukprot:6240199-Prymnesium_polylepis.2